MTITHEMSFIEHFNNQEHDQERAVSPNTQSLSDHHDPSDARRTSALCYTQAMDADARGMAADSAKGSKKTNLKRKAMQTSCRFYYLHETYLYSSSQYFRAILENEVGNLRLRRALSKGGAARLL